MMEPTIEAIASDTDAAVAKVDVDANPEIAQQLGARSIPTLLVYADDGGRSTGLRARRTERRWSRRSNARPDPPAGTSTRIAHTARPVPCDRRTAGRATSKTRATRLIV